MRYFVLIGFLMFGLTACFRDASDNGNDATSLPVVNFVNTPTLTPSPNAQIPTLTATPRRAPTDTLAPGGPRFDETEEADEPAANPSATADEAESEADTQDLPATIPIPSFTPRASDAITFGDTGITPTSALPTQPVPDALVTPTALPDDAPGIEDCIHVVQAGDTLTRIAETYETEVDAMVAANPVLGGNLNALSIGQELSIPDCTPTFEEVRGEEAPPTEEAVSPDEDETEADETQTVPAESGVHIVQEGDNLFRIALNYGITVEAIVAANPSLTSENDILQIGQELIIPSP